MESSMIKTLGLPMEKTLLISLAGAGGKTTVLYALGRELAEAGKDVLLTTTTHMFRERGCDLSGNAGKILEKLNTTNPLLAGIGCEQEPDKIQKLPDDVFAQLTQQVSAVLVEADGAKRLPFKVPAAHEPVIPKESTHIFVVAGMSAIGRPLAQVCHRWQTAARWLDTKENTLLTPAMAGALLEYFYIDPLKARFPQAQVGIWCNQADDARRQAFARELLEQTREGEGYLTSFEKGELRCIRKFSKK
ncbi:MAG: selenium cofactor biosynthesis protein YqeC [Blautia sp.]